MNTEYPFQKSPRCTATSKRTRERCKAPAVKGWSVCRFHGANGGGPSGSRNGRYVHGLYTREALEERKSISALIQKSRKALGENE